MANIAQLSSLTGRGQAILAEVFRIAPLFQQIECKLDASTHFVTPDKDTYTGAAARAVGAALQRDAQAPNPTARTLALYGREYSIDDLYKSDQNVGLSPAGLRLFADRKLKGLAVKLAEEVLVDIFQGTDAANRMLGIGNFIKDADAGGQTAALGFTAAEIAAMRLPAALDLSDVASQNSFIELLEREMANVPGANLLICNSYLKARLATIARRLGAAGETRNSFGTPLATFNSVPIVPVSVSAITNTETDGVNANLTSLYIARTAEDLGVALSTNSGFKFDDFDMDTVKPNQVARLQMFLNLTVEKADALRRISRIKL